MQLLRLLVPCSLALTSPATRTSCESSWLTGGQADPPHRHRERSGTALENAPLLHADPDPHAHVYHPKTVSRVVDRIKALTLELLPIQVSLGESSKPAAPRVRLGDDARRFVRDGQGKESKATGEVSNGEDALSPAAASHLSHPSRTARRSSPSSFNCRSADLLHLQQMSSLPPPLPS